MYVEVILPVPVPGLFSYALPQGLEVAVQPGMRVVVPFGPRRILTGIIRFKHDQPAKQDLKAVLEILDGEPLVSPAQFGFWEWLSAYYMCSLCEVMMAALPSVFRLASETTLEIHPDFDGNMDVLNHHEQAVAEALAMQDSLSLSQVSEITGLGKVVNLVRTLIQKRVVQEKEIIQLKYKEKKENIYLLHPDFRDETVLSSCLTELSRKANKQMEVMMTWLQETGVPANGWDVALAAGPWSQHPGYAAALVALTRKGILIKESRVVSRLATPLAKASTKDIQYTDIQREAISNIRKHWDEKDVNLLFGVTGSGKTEIYLHLIQEYLEKGKQILYLLPEIALTTQIIDRLRHYLGHQVGVYHSRYPDAERAEIWQQVLGFSPGSTGQSHQVVLGARSALLLPFRDLGLIIIDEEHDPSYKQVDPAPRYHARDAALWLARQHGAKVLMGSATPAVETFAHALAGRFGLIRLDKRYLDQMLPEILVVDIREEAKKRRMYSLFTGTLLSHIEEALNNKEQVILFQNRRGFALRLECDVCQWIPQCLHCDVTLIYHKKEGHLRCHYCGYTQTVPQRCPACASTGIKMKGFGTEKIEEELKAFLPDARIARMDLDTTRSRQAYHTFIQAFSDRQIDILVGTQMVTKGLDFDNVSTVGILNADHMLSYPDFRAMERSYQLMAQVSGRSGRKGKRGRVIIQTSQPGQKVIHQVINNDYEGMFRDQMTERDRFSYPPFSRLILIRLQHRDAKTLDQAAAWLAAALRDALGKRVLGPEYPLISRIRNEYIKHILVKVDRKESVKDAKRLITQSVDALMGEALLRRVRVILDVDPV